MNSSVVSEQRRGKGPGDIMAGLCRSIIENVFTKVIRVSNLNRLGDKVVVQGGTFRNDAVLRAFEQYLGKPVTRSPHPGLMGAIGIALLAREECRKGDAGTSFIGLDAVERFEHREFGGVTCRRCNNRCQRAVVAFGDGSLYVTGNRCPRGVAISWDELVREVPAAEELRPQGACEAQAPGTGRDRTAAAPNLFVDREKLLFESYPTVPVSGGRDVTIGIPRVLEFWDTMPFWSTFFSTLGFKVRVSGRSTKAMYERGLAHVTSDTVCFPAKLVHGHIRNLVDAGVDRIFMPIITTVPTENTASTSEWMCAVVKGYPYVMRNSDNPEERFGVPFDTPLFHWYDEGDRNRQLKAWCKETFDIDADLVAKVFSERGIPVLTPDAVPGVCNVDLSNSRIDIVNNYHARMLSCAVIVASTPELELVQMGSFGCGHDAYLTDEIARMMGEMGSKVPMMIKLDESDVAGPMGIRVRSFIESVNRRRAEERAEGARVHAVHPLDDPYNVKYTKRDRHDKIALVPNTSHAFCRLMTAAMRNQGVRAEALDIGREDAIRLGKRYVHNDICFPAQIVIGEALAALESGKYDPHDVAVVTGKYIGDCRLTHYMPLLRRALDDAGYDYVPVLTNDDVDAHNAHPGFKLGLGPSIQIAYGLPMIDALEAMLRRIRPYELEKGAADAAFERALAIMDAVPYDRSNPHPTVLIVGEYLLNFHLGANHEIERYLEDNGLEVIEARMTDVIRKTYFYKHAQSREFHVDLSLPEKAWYATADNLFELAHDRCDRLGAASPLYEPPTRMPELVRASDKILHHTFDAGEGVLIPAEILEHAKRGCRNFVILQPFGCLPNHVVGRGLIHALKEQYPTAQFLPLDYDPDVSFANVENRLQMLIMNAKAQGCGEAHGETA